MIKRQKHGVLSVGCQWNHSLALHRERDWRDGRLIGETSLAAQFHAVVNPHGQAGRTAVLAGYALPVLVLVCFKT